MFAKMMVITIVGIMGGVAHRLLFEKRLYLPKFKKDRYGRYLDLGLLEDVFAGIIAAFAVALPIVEHVPVVNLIASCFVPSIAGRAFLKNAIEKYVEEKKRLLKDEIEKLEHKEKMSKEGKEEVL